MIIPTRRVKPDKLSRVAQSVIADRDYWVQAYLETASELRQVRRERDEARAKGKGPPEAISLS